MRRLFVLIYSFILIISSFLLYIPIPEAQAINFANTPATIVIGQSSFISGGQNHGNPENGYRFPFSVFYVNGKLIVADYDSNRVLIYNSIPTLWNQKPDIIIGQTNLVSVSANQGGSVRANTLYSPRGIYSDGTKLFISDLGNNRVLIYNTIPTTNNASADVVIGQPDMTSNTANNGGVSAHSLSYPSNTYSDGTRLFISDAWNQRVLIYDTIPTSNNASANVVVGQPDMTSNTANNGGITANTLNYPSSSIVNSGKLLISDSNNNRVLIFNSIPETNGAGANFVIGASDMTHAGSGGATASTVWTPSNLFIQNGHLYIADVNNLRVLVYNSIPASNGIGADIVIGQENMTSKISSPSDKILYCPYSVTSDGTKLFIVDLANRLLIYNTIPNANYPTADMVIGQPNVTNMDSYGGLTEVNTLKAPHHLSFSNNRFFAADFGNNRVLIYNSIPSGNDAAAYVVVGQPDMTSNVYNNGGINANTVYGPIGVYTDGIHLFVADSYNNRVLIYNTIPTSNNAAADVVVGQLDMVTRTTNYGGRSARSLGSPYGVFSDGIRLFVADTSNNRVLIWNSIPTNNYDDADVVIGQPNMTSGTANNGGLNANTLNGPTGVFFDGTKLYIVDRGNSRILIYNSLSIVNTSADVVVGQDDMTSAVYGTAANRFANSYSVFGVYSDGTRLFATDRSNNRVLVWNTIPTTNGVSADIVLGQPDMTSNTINNGGISATSMYSPNGVVVGSGYIFVSEYNNNRILMYPLGPQGTSITSLLTYTNSLNNTFTLASDDAKEMMVSEDNTFTGLSWETFSTSKQFTLSNGDGLKTVYAKMRDYANYEGEVLSAQITYDVTGPTGTISINSGATITNTDEVTLTLTATDNLSGISKMMVSNKVDYSGGTWETYNTSKEWRLSMEDGEKKVYVKYRDEVGNISSSYSDSIEMDMGAPTGTLIINEGEEYTSSREVVLHITGEDLPAQAGEVTGVEEMRISEDRTMEGVDWEGYETSREYTLSEGDGYKVIYIQYRDGIGNESEVYGSNITLDSQTEIDITEIGEEEVEGEITEWETEETSPTFTGEGEVGATITIEIEGIETGTVIVNEDGVWSWTPSIELIRGQEYNVTIISTDLVGNEDVQTFTLGITDEEVINVNQTTPETQTTTTQLPNTGMIFLIGVMLMGGLLWTGMNFKVIQKLRKNK